MADAPFGVPGDPSRDDAGASSRVVVSTADRLRTLADWLDAHPGAVVSEIVTYSRVWRVLCFKPDTVEQMRDMACAIEPGNWTFRDDEHHYAMVRPVAPEINFELYLSRAKVAEATA